MCSVWFQKKIKMKDGPKHTKHFTIIALNGGLANLKKNLKLFMSQILHGMILFQMESGFFVIKNK